MPAAISGQQHPSSQLPAYQHPSVPASWHPSIQEEYRYGKFKNADYSVLDRPEVLRALFHPRPETGTIGSADNGLDLLIPVEENIRVGARFHIRDKTCPNILFFHGNGEIVSDYDDLGPMYNRLGINFLPVDYRGTAAPTARPPLPA